MRLYLVRHATAKDAAPDGIRPLNGKGRKETRRCARALKRLKVKGVEIWHSPLLRAAQTATRLAAALGSKRKVYERDSLAPAASADGLAPVLERQEDDLMLVGHQPHLGRLASALLSRSAGADFVDLPKGGAACLERGQSGWILRWMIAPDALG